MDNAEDAIRFANSKDLVTALTDLSMSRDDYKSLLDLALSLDDYDTIWYLLERASLEDIGDLDNYVISKCGRNGQTLPCQVLSRRDGPVDALREAIITTNTDIIVYSIDLLYHPLNRSLLEDYDTEDFLTSQEISSDINRLVESILLEAKPNYLLKIFPVLPENLKANLLIRAGLV